jgi:putative zinc finger protein
MTMCDKELLVSYLYDELQGPERKAFQHHLVSCRDCQQEVQGLRATRSHLESWPVPEPALGLQLPAAEAVARSRFRMSPAWGLAAAAVLVLAIASAVANLEITAGAEGLTIRTGWSRAGSVPPAAAAVDAASRQDVVAIQQRVRELEAALAAQAQTPAATPVSLASGSGAPAADLLRNPELVRRVRQWISESEQRQQQMLAARLVQAMREVQAEHSTDLVRLEQAINRSQGLWNDEVFRQREEMKQFYRIVNSQQQQR